MTFHTRCASCNTLERDVTPFLRRHVDLRPYARSSENCHRNVAHQQGEKCSYWDCQVTQRVGSATRTPDVEAVAVVRIVWRAEQVRTVSPTSSRHRQVLKHDAFDLGDEGVQHHAVERRHNAIFDRGTCSLSSSSQLAQNTRDVISEEDGRQKSMFWQIRSIFSATPDGCPEQ